jgi:hypothetical protein
MSSENHLPDSPPPEVERAIAAASQACDELDATGHRIHFGLEQDARSVAVELRDLRGNQLSTLTPNDALQIASEWLD